MLSAKTQFVNDIETTDAKRRYQPQQQKHVSMARTAVLFATIATYLSLSLAQDRLNRSGDLDRGPPEVTRDDVAGTSYKSPSSIDFYKSDIDLDHNFNLGTVDVNSGDSANSAVIKENGINGPNSEAIDTDKIDSVPIYFGKGEVESYSSKQPIEKTDLNVGEVANAELFNSSLALQRRLEMSTEFFLVPNKPSSVTTPTGTFITKTECSGCTLESNKIVGFFRNEAWVIPVLALSSVTMLLIAGFEVFVLCKAYRTTPSRRHLFLGQMLLLGLFSCAALGAVFAVSPTQLTCAIVRFGTGVSYAIIFSSLLVKCVFLVSLNGGVYLPAPYQGLLLLFAILIQIAIGAQWLVTNPPLVDDVTFESLITTTNKHRLLVTAEDLSKPTVVPLCRTPFIDMLLSLIYVIFLIVFVTVLAVKSRGIRDNYREATYIGLSVGCSIPTWIVWIMSGFVVNERHKDACIAFGLVITSVMVFLIMFMPKGRQLAAMGKEGVYVEDREERFSSLSRAGSGYSPSFFHFKPMKCGITHGTSHKHQHGITTLGPDLALYPAPPSYTRLYQCYPSPPGYYSSRYLTGGVYLRPDDGNLYTTLEPTLSSNPNVYFQRGNGVHPGMMY